MITGALLETEYFGGTQLPVSCKQGNSGHVLFWRVRSEVIHFAGGTSGIVEGWGPRKAGIFICCGRWGSRGKHHAELWRTAMKGKIAFIVMIAVTALFTQSSYAVQIEPSIAPNLVEIPQAPVGTPICGPTENVSGSVSTNTTWSAGKVYVLTGDITVTRHS